MTAVLFEVDGQRYGLDVAQVIRVVPYVHLRQLPGVPEYVAGVLRYRDGMVPVIDLNRLMGGRPAAVLLSTRIILAHYPAPSGPNRALGLLAERATDSIEDSRSELTSSGIATPEAPYLGGLSSTGAGVVQYVKVEQLLPDELRERLFVES